MKARFLAVIGLVGILAFAQGVQADAAYRLGVGATYWKMMDDIDVDDIDEDGFSWMVTYRYKPAALLGFQIDLEVFPDKFQGIDGETYAPAAYLVLGSTIYGAAGVGLLYADGEFDDTPFYSLRAGLDLEILPQVYLDINANYRFSDTTDLSDVADDIDTDTLMLGAALRIEF